MNVVPLLLLINMMCTRDDSSRTAGGIGTAWSHVIGSGYGMGYRNHAEDPVWVMCIHVLKVSEKTYRRACNQPMNYNFNQLSRRINDLYRGRHMKRLWNFIRSTKRDNSVHDDIGVSDLHKYFSAKFCDSEYTSDVILEAEICVPEKYDDLLNGELNSKVMSEAMVKRYIKKLHLGSSPCIRTFDIRDQFRNSATP